jgi:hypothetical protein
MEATAHKQRIAGANDAAADSFRISVKYNTSAVNCYQANLNYCVNCYQANINYCINCYQANLNYCMIMNAKLTSN